jgi:hypothetical protein
VYLLEVEPLDLGPDVKAVGLDLCEFNEEREPARGPEAAKIWSRVLPTVAATEPWALDFFSHLDRVRDYCERHGIAWRDASSRSIVIPAPSVETQPAALAAFFTRFEGETFGARAGGPLPSADATLETDLARRGVDAYHPSFPLYFFCAICNFEQGSLVLLTRHLWAGEVIRRVKPVVADLDLEMRLPT